MSEQVFIQRVAESRISCASIVITLFGDVVAQHGGSIAMFCLIKVLRCYGFNERQVRTAVFRLTQSDWLTAKKIGRNSYYSFTQSARAHYTKAAQRVYASPTQDAEWNGVWTLVAPIFVSEKQRDALRRNLRWQGFHLLVNGMYARPSWGREEHVQLGIAEHDKDVLIFHADPMGRTSKAMIEKIVKTRWDLSELRGKYQAFLDVYRPFEKRARQLLPKESFLLRCLLVHEYRRILLRDFELPQSMLPSNWEGRKAGDLFRLLYMLLVQRSEHYITSVLVNASGKLPAASASFFTRFGGLPQELHAASAGKESCRQELTSCP